MDTIHTHIHPAFVYFPILFVFIAFLFDILSYYLKKKSWVITVAVLFTVISTIFGISALITGFLFAPNIGGHFSTLKDFHLVCATVSVMSLVVASGLGVMYLSERENSVKVRVAYTIFIVIAAVSVFLTSFEGFGIATSLYI